MEMDDKQDNPISEANLKLNQEFYGEETQPTRWIKNGSPRESENANMQIDRIFNSNDEDDSNLQNRTSLRRGNG